MATLPENHNEFRSDTFTTPTPSLLAQVARSSVGDSVYNEDQDTILLEKTIAEMAGHESGLYCVSGTLSNQIAIRAHLKQPPYSVLCDHRAHIYRDEAAGLATLSQAMVTPVIPSNGNYITLEDVISNFIPDSGDIHEAPTKLICLENTLHGVIFPIEEIIKIRKFCDDQGVGLHVDGARLWDASAATGISIKEYGKLFDSMSLCLSKSLGAPIGSVLVGSKSLIMKANHFRKQNGGGIRQCGMLARMALYAVEQHFKELPKAHAMAKEVADYAVGLGMKLESPVDTNFVFLDQKLNKIDPRLFKEYGARNGIKCGQGFRFAFSFQTSREAVDALKKTLKEVFEEAQRSPYTNERALGIYI